MELPAAGQSEARASPGRVAYRSPIRNSALRSPARRVAPPGPADADAPAPSPVVSGDLFTDDSSEAAKVRRLSKENRTLRQKLKELQLEAAEEKQEVDSLIEELSKEIIELTEENQEAHRINDQMSAEIVHLREDLEQLEAKLDGRRQSEYQKVLDALSRQQDGDGALDLLHQIRQLEDQLEHVEREKVDTDRRLAKTARAHSSAIASRQSHIDELRTMLDVANAEIAALKRSPVEAVTAARTRSGHAGGVGDDTSWNSGRTRRAGGQNYASSLEEMESGSSASESGDSCISASSGAASNSAVGGSSGASSGWLLWPGRSNQQNGRRAVGRDEELPT